MDSNEQINQVPAQQSAPVVEPVVTAEPVVAEKSHMSALHMIVLLLVVAAVLFIILGATSKMHRDTDQYMPENSDSVIMEGSVDTSSTDQKESDAIRADLEAGNTDGVSEGI